MGISTLDRITKYSLLVFAFSIPWSSALYRMSVLSLCLCLVAYIGLEMTGVHQKNNGLSLLRLESSINWIWPLVLTIWVFLTWFWTSGSSELYRFDAWRYVKLLMIPVIAYFIQRLFFLDELKVIKAFCFGIIVLITPTYLDYLGVFKYFEITDLIKGDAPYQRNSSIGLNLVYWRNHIVHGFHVAMLFGVSLLTLPKQGARRYGHFIIAAFCVFDVLYLIIGKMALLSLAASSLVVVLLSFKQDKFKYLMGCVLVFVLILLFSNGAQQRLLMIWTEATSFFSDHRIDTSTGNRLHYWGISLELFLNHPIIGSGAGSFRQWLISTSDPLSQSFHYHTHNEYLTQLSQFGIIGLTLFSGVLYLSVKSVQVHPNSVVKNCVWLVMVVFALNAFSDSSLHNEWEGWTLVLFASIAIANQMRFKPDV